MQNIAVSYDVADRYYFEVLRAWSMKFNNGFYFSSLHVDEDEIDDIHKVYEYKKQKMNECNTFLFLVSEEVNNNARLTDIEVATSANARIIVINLNGKMSIDSGLIPKELKDIGAMFVGFHIGIIKFALKNYEKKEEGNKKYSQFVYEKLKIKHANQKVKFQTKSSNSSQEIKEAKEMSKELDEFTKEKNQQENEEE